VAERSNGKSKKPAARKAAAKKSAAKKPAAKSSSSEETTTRGTAPSAADIDKLEKFEPSEEAKAHEPSDVDAMGQDKRREVVGHSYGPSRRSQVVFFGIVIGLIVLLIGGSLAAVNAFDQPEDEYPDEAPWVDAEDKAGEVTCTQVGENGTRCVNNEGEVVSPRDPSGPCGSPGNPPEFDQGTACTNVRTSDQGPALPGKVPPGGGTKSVTDQKAGSGGASGSSGSTGAAN
jgi:hypothetical protein